MAGGCGELPSKKNNNESGCPKSRKVDNGQKTGKDAFGRDICEHEEDIKEIECHESRKRFFDKSNEPKDNKRESHQKREEPKEEKNCEDASKKATQTYRCKETSTGSNNCCFSSVRGDSARKCAPRGESSFGSKVESWRKSVDDKVDPKPKQSSCGARDEKLPLPEPRVMVVRPCLPRVEKGAAAKRKIQTPCITTESMPSCQQTRKPGSGWAEFFCIDARNKRMNECIKQYMSTDPSQVNIQCAQFAGRKRMHTGTPQPPPPAGAGFLPPKYRQIARR